MKAGSKGMDVFNVVQVRHVDPAASSPLMAFTVPASLYTGEGVLEHVKRLADVVGLLGAHVVPVLNGIRAGCLFAGLARWRAQLDAALRRAPHGVWSAPTLTQTHQVGGSMSVRL